MLNTWLPNIVTGFVAILASWFLAGWYFRRGGDELRREACELRRLTKMILDGLEAAHLVEVRRNERGEPTGINITLTPGQARLTLSGHEPTMVVSQAPKQP